VRDSSNKILKTCVYKHVGKHLKEMVTEKIPKRETDKITGKDFNYLDIKGNLITKDYLRLIEMRKLLDGLEMSTIKMLCRNLMDGCERSAIFTYREPSL
jgi:hypothetical protein